MPKYWEKQIFSLGSFPKGGQKQTTEGKKKKKKKLKVGNNNGHLLIANAKPPGPIFQGCDIKAIKLNLNLYKTNKATTIGNGIDNQIFLFCYK